MNESIRRLLVGCLGVVAMAYGAFANDQIPGAKQKRPIVIKNATVHCVDRSDIVQGSVVLDAGKIVAVGSTAKLVVPPGSQVIDAEGMHVYPGLIESMTDLGLREILAVDVTLDREELGLKNPNVRSWVAVNPDSELIPVARAGGVLLAHVSPTGRFVRGQSAVMQLDGWSNPDMTLKGPAGLSVNWEYLHAKDNDSNAEAKKRDERLQELQDWFDQARRYQAARAEQPDEPARDLRLESLFPVLSGDVPVFAHADRLTTIESAVAFAVRNELKLVIFGGYDATECADLLKKHSVPVIVSGIYRLPLRRDDPYDAAYTLPERLRKAGVEFAICGEGPGYPGGSSNTRNLPYHAGNAVAYGLPREVAVQSITLNAAKILGVGDVVGSITQGKDATLIVCDGDVLETETQVKHAFIQGRAVDLSSKHTMLFDKYQEKYKP